MIAVVPRLRQLLKHYNFWRCIDVENLRYHNEETKNDPEFAKQLASLADVAK